MSVIGALVATQVAVVNHEGPVENGVVSARRLRPSAPAIGGGDNRTRAFGPRRVICRKSKIFGKHEHKSSN